MPNSRNDFLVKRYLENLNWALRDLPPTRRNPIVEDIAEHIRTAREDMAEETEAGIRRLLDQVGDPETIRAEADLPPIPAPNWGDRWTPWLLLFGGFVFFVGWIFGVVLLWQSSLWRTSDKILGALVWPGGLAAVVFLGLSVFFTSSVGAIGSCTGQVGGPQHCSVATVGPDIPVIIPVLVMALAVGGPILIAVRLLHAYRRVV